MRTPQDEIPSWEHFPHGADIGVRGVGCSLSEAFEQAALALTGIVLEPKRLVPSFSVALACEEPDPELLPQTQGSSGTWAWSGSLARR